MIGPQLGPGIVRGSPGTVLPSTSDRECGAEPVQCDEWVAGRPGLGSARAGVADPVQRGGHGRIVDLAGARLAPAWYVRHLHLADRRAGQLDERDEVPLADLRVVEVEHRPHVRAAD